MTIPLAIFGTLLGVVALGFGVWVFSIWYEVARAPKAEMFQCPRHGAILEKDLIYWMEQPACPLCFSDRLTWAETRGEKGHQ